MADEKNIYIMNFMVVIVFLIFIGDLNILILSYQYLNYQVHVSECDWLCLYFYIYGIGE